MIETRRGEGSFVRVNRLADYFRPAFLFSVDNHEMEEIYAFRSMFESATAEAAARKATLPRFAAWSAITRACARRRIIMSSTCTPIWSFT